MLNVKDRDLVVPGDLIGSDITPDLNCYIEEGKYTPQSKD